MINSLTCLSRIAINNNIEFIIVHLLQESAIGDGQNKSLLDKIMEGTDAHGPSLANPNVCIEKLRVIFISIFIAKRFHALGVFMNAAEKLS